MINEQFSSRNQLLNTSRTSTGLFFRTICTHLINWLSLLLIFKSKSCIADPSDVIFIHTRSFHIRDETFAPGFHRQVAVNLPLAICFPAESLRSFAFMTNHQFAILKAAVRSSEGAFVWLGWHRLAYWHATWHFGAVFTALETKLEHTHTQTESFPSKIPSPSFPSPPQRFAPMGH